MTVFSEGQLMTEIQPKDMYDYLTGLVKQAVITYFKQEHIEFDAAQLAINLRVSAQASFGDYSMPVMAWAGKDKLKRPPLQIAEALAAILRDIPLSTIGEISATKPGYLNFRLNRPQVGKEIIERVAEAGPDFGQDDAGVGIKVII